MGRQIEWDDVHLVLLPQRRGFLAAPVRTNLKVSPVARLLGTFLAYTVQCSTNHNTKGLESIDDSARHLLCTWSLSRKPRAQLLGAQIIAGSLVVLCCQPGRRNNAREIRVCGVFVTIAFSSSALLANRPHWLTTVDQQCAKSRNPCCLAQGSRGSSAGTGASGPSPPLG